MIRLNRSNTEWLKESVRRNECTQEFADELLREMQQQDDDSGIDPIARTVPREPGK